MLMLWGQHPHQGVSVPFPSFLFPNSAMCTQEQLARHQMENLLAVLPTTTYGFNNQRTKDD